MTAVDYATTRPQRCDPMTENADAVLEEIEVQIELLDKRGGTYAREYFAHMLSRRDAGNPRPPAGMHPLIARALRDMVADEATAVRLYGPGRPPGGTR